MTGEHVGTSPHLTDAELVPLASAGDVGAFERLYHRYYAVAFGAALRYTASRTRAEDVASEVFLWLCEGRWRIDGSVALVEGRIDPFVRKLAHFASQKLSYRASVDRHTVRNDEDGVLLLRLHARGPTPEAQLLRRELRRHLRGAIHSLTPRMRRVALLRYFHDLSGPDIAAAVGVLPVTVPGYLNVIRHHIRAELAGYLNIPGPSGRSRGGHRRYANKQEQP
ncbi:MAG: sigma-70 family RNA polymerase sigma factor [Vicinamibacterales bacterium]